MKTPREILSERHQAAEAKLGALRRQVVQEHSLSKTTGKIDARDSNVSTSTFVEKIWLELILPCRRIWIGLTTVWLVILGMNFITSGGVVQPTLAKISPPSPEVLTELKEQKQMMAQLLGPIASPPARPTAPGPSSRRREQISAV